MNQRWFLVYIVLAMSGGLVGCLLYIQQQPYCKHYIQRAIIEGFEKSFECTFKAHLQSCNLLIPEIILVDAQAHSLLEQGWSWHAKKVCVRFSWFTYLFKKIFLLKFDLFDVSATSYVHENIPDILHHLKKMIIGKPGLAIGLSSLSIYRGNIVLIDTLRNITLKTDFAQECAVLAQRFNTQLYLKNLCVMHNNNSYISDGTLTVRARFARDANPWIKAEGGMYCLSGVDRKRVEAQCNGDSALLVIQNADHTVRVQLEADCKNVKKKWHFATDIQATVSDIKPFVLHYNLWPQITSYIDGHWTAKISGCMHKGNYHAQGDIVFAGLYKKHAIDAAVCATLKDQKLEGILNAGYNDYKLTSTIAYDFSQQTGSCFIKTPTSITIEPFGTIDSQSSLHMYLHKGSITGDYSFAAFVPFLKKDIKTAGKVIYNNKGISVKGTFEQHCYTANIMTNPWWLVNAQWFDNNNKLVMTIKGDGNKSLLQGDIDPQFLQPCIKKYIGQEINNDAQCLITMQPKSLYSWDIKARILKAGIRVAKTYNALRSCTADIVLDLQKKIARLNSTFILEKGVIVLKEGIIELNDHYYIKNLFLPCSFSKLFINQHKDLLANASGWLIGHYREHEQPSINGCVIIDRGQLRKNIFSSSLQEDIINPWMLPHVSLTLGFSITVQTKNPIQVKTSFLETQASIDILVKGTLHNPLVVGTIQVHNGTLAFPYKNLTIMSGKLDFLPHQLHDPLIELTAKNRIRKYHVTMRIDGSLQQPRIVFESTPTLSEEQIITLLVAGNEEGSLSLIMPSLIMPQIKKIIFGPEQTPSRLQHYFNNLMAPLKNIRIVPSFSDQTGRGGFRGSIIIDVNDQLHGVIQKNFSLPEDTRFEVDYMLSDDISLRAIKDERGDLGGECEVRWKF